uniref:Brix domain-containing protein n=1 Tax=Entomoneis paludosa TaxID=265537 RepID=A0A7S3DYG7_9STRA
MAKKSRKKRTHVPEDGTDGSGSKVPKSLVIRRGKTAAEVSELVQDLRHMMMPYTAINFQEDARNRKLTLQQYSKHVALPMGISHLMAFSQNDNRLNLRLGRTPEGPTLHFRVHKFSLSKHIKALQKRPVSNTAGLQSNPPVVVTNNFGDTSNNNSASAAAPHVKLMRITFQNLFPAINVAAVKLSECRRVVLFNLIPGESTSDTPGEEGSEKTESTPLVEMRHYAIQANAVGVHRRVRKLASSSKRKLPNLHKVQDIADYVTGQTATGGGSVASDAAPSDSEAEDDPRHTIDLPDSYMGQRKSQKSALKLVEIGPRLTLSLVKVEKGLGHGDILYHAFVKKSPEEVATMKAKKEKEASLKQERKATQEANVERKRKAAEEKREAKRKRKEEREKSLLERLRQGNPDKDENEQSSASSSGSGEED